MAAGARRVLGADVGLALTGVAGPTEQDGHAGRHAVHRLASADGSDDRVRCVLGGSASRCASSA